MTNKRWQIGARGTVHGRKNRKAVVTFTVIPCLIKKWFVDKDEVASYLSINQIFLAWCQDMQSQVTVRTKRKTTTRIHFAGYGICDHKTFQRFS